MSADDLQRTVAFIGERVDAHLCSRTGTWLASFAELVAMAEDSGVPTGPLQPVLLGLLGADAGEVLDDEQREVLRDALVGRWAATRYRDLR